MQFGYNGDGIRLRLVEAGTSTTYTQDYAAPLPVVLQAKTGTTTTQYVYSLGTRPLSEYEAAAWEYLLPDPLGSVRQIANNSGNVTLLKSYEPYGSVLISQGGAASIFGYSGEQTDNTGLVYLRTRYYASESGRFITKDTWMGDITQSISQNSWLYAHANPINFTDPSGLWIWSAQIGVLHLPVYVWYETDGGKLPLGFNPNKQVELKIILGMRVDMFNSRLGDVYEVEPIYDKDSCVGYGGRLHAQCQAHVYVKLLNWMAQHQLLKGTGPTGTFDWNRRRFDLGTGIDWPGKLDTDISGGFDLVHYKADYYKPGVITFWIEATPKAVALVGSFLSAYLGKKVAGKDLVRSPGFDPRRAYSALLIEEFECEALVSVNGQIMLVDILRGESMLEGHNVRDYIPTDYGFFLVDPYEQFGVPVEIDDTLFGSDEECDGCS